MFDRDYVVVVGLPFSLRPSTVSGVNFTENNNYDESCLNSTLTFIDNLTSLTALNGVTLNCTSGDYEVTPSSVTFMIPSK